MPKKQDMSRKKGGRGKPRLLRGETLVRAAQAVLARWVNLSPKTHPINVSRLAKELGVTRQAIYDNKLKRIIDDHKALQQSNSTIQSEAKVLRRPLEDRIASQDKKAEELQRALDGYIEKFVTVEYNARMLGINPDQLFAPIPLPDRAMNLGTRGRRKDNDE